MFGARSEKFRSIRSYPGIFHMSDERAVDFSEFTKSDREKSAETLFAWRSRDGWQVSKRTLLPRKSIAYWIVAHTVFAASVLAYYFL